MRGIKKIVQLWIKYFLATILLLSSIKILFAQSFPKLQFEHLTTKDGLSSDLATVVTEDKHGFIWVGTNDGLARYDGYRFKEYYHSDRDSNSLVNNIIENLFCDSKGRIWISTAGGISCFLPAENQFVNYSTHLPNPYFIPGNSSVNVYEDNAHEIWLCNTGSSLFHVQPDLTLNEVAINISSFNDERQQVFVGYNNIYLDSNKKEWAFRQNRIYLLNSKTKQTDKFFDLSNSFHGIGILKMLQINNGHYLLCTWGGGIFDFDPQKGVALLIKNSPQKIIPSMINWRYKGTDWIVCAEIDKGIYLINKNSLEAKYYPVSTNNASSATWGNNFLYVYKDSHNNLWMPSSRGLNKVSVQQKPFEIFPVTEPGTEDYDLRYNGSVCSYFESDSSVWLSKRWESTFEYDSSMKIKNFYKTLYPRFHQGEFATFFANSFFKKENELFISTDSGLIVHNLLSRTNSFYFPSVQSKFIDFRTIISFSKDEIMIRSYQNGIFIFNTVSKKFSKYFTNKDTCASCLPFYLNYLFKTSKNKIYVSTTAKGLFVYDEKTSSFIPAELMDSKHDAIRNSRFYGMAEAMDGTLWITGTDGLLMYDPQKNIAQKRKDIKGPKGELFRICFDKYDNAWMCGTDGIWCYQRIKDKWVNFNGQDGLPGSDFENIIAAKRNGDIVAGLESAIAIFHPDKLFHEQPQFPVIITEAIIGDSTVSLTGDSKKKEIKIFASQNSFSVDFALLNYITPAANRYYYKLLPSMKDFQLNSDGHINFNGIAPGTYTLHVKGGDKEGNVFSQEDQLKIIIEPNWYQTWWFKLLLIIVTLAGIIFFVKRRIANIRKAAGLKQKIAETEMQALRAQMNPHFIFNSLNSIENFMMKNDKRMASDYFSKFASLIRMILDSSRNELVPFSKDLEALKLYVELEQLRFNHTFSYKTIIDPALLNGDYRVPPLLIQPFVENAILHGLAQSDRNNGELIVAAALENDYISYSIQDNGIGRKESASYMQQNKPSYKSMGMQITQERINIFNKQQHAKGEIVVTDLYDEHDGAAGTKVMVKFKAI